MRTASKQRVGTITHATRAVPYPRLCSGVPFVPAEDPLELPRLLSGRKGSRRVIPGGLATVPRLTCGQAGNRMGRALAGELERAEWRMFRKHLRVCSGCHDTFLVMELSLSLSAGILVAVT